MHLEKATSLCVEFLATCNEVETSYDQASTECRKMQSRAISAERDEQTKEKQKVQRAWIKEGCLAAPAAAGASVSVASGFATLAGTVPILGGCAVALTGAVAPIVGVPLMAGIYYYSIHTPGQAAQAAKRVNEMADQFA